jgi:hypothetical protein
LPILQLHLAAAVHDRNWHELTVCGTAAVPSAM